MCEVTHANFSSHLSSQMHRAMATGEVDDPDDQPYNPRMTRVILNLLQSQLRGVTRRLDSLEEKMGEVIKALSRPTRLDVMEGAPLTPVIPEIPVQGFIQHRLLMHDAELCNLRQQLTDVHKLTQQQIDMRKFLWSSCEGGVAMDAEPDPLPEGVKQEEEEKDQEIAVDGQVSLALVPVAAEEEAAAVEGELEPSAKRHRHS